MEKIILENYSRFLQELPQDWEDLSGLAHTPLRYYYLANIQIQSFKAALQKEFHELKHNMPRPQDYSEQCYAYCYGFYPLIRTCLEAASKFSVKFQNRCYSQSLKEFRDEASPKIKKIIDIANDYIKHPVENQGKVTWYEPGGLYNSGLFRLYEWSSVDNKHFETLTIEPIKDMQEVSEYLEKLGELYYLALQLNKSKMGI